MRMRLETEKTSVQDDLLYTITNIQRFATHDGPGIRTVVFFKGCPLHCPWCANPETWRAEPELFHDDSLCMGCGRCVTACPKGAVAVIGGKARVNRTLCDGCGSCVTACLNKAMEVTGNRMTIPEILAEIRKDDEYYQASGGGVTLSGGEVFAQDPVPLLRALKDAGYHTAIETEGAYDLEKLAAALPWIDLVYHDVKHCDPHKLKKFTGADAEEITRHLRYLKDSDVRTIIRIPVIPGFNLEDLDNIRGYVKDLGFSKMQLLPFHPMGKGKWHKLDRRYPYEQTPMMDKTQLDAWREAGTEIGGH